MGQTWLNRKIKGPSAVGGEGDPPKKKGGVIPYITYDRDDPRIQAHSDSLASYNNSNNEYYENIKWQDEKRNASEAAYESGLSDDMREFRRSHGYEYKPTPILSKQEYVSRGRKWAQPVTDVYYNSGGGNPSEQTHYINPNTTDWRKYGGEVAPGTPGHSSMKNKSIKPTSFIQSDGYVGAVFFDKPKQEVILKGLEKMPIRKLKSNYNTPEKLSNRKPETLSTAYYDKPRKTSLAVTGHPGSKKQYATVNRQDKKGTVFLNKAEYKQETQKIFLKQTK